MRNLSIGVVSFHIDRSEMKKPLSLSIIIACFVLFISCETKSPQENPEKITNIPDTTLARFSYSLIPAWAQHKSTSFYDYRKPVIETAGSFTSAGANEVLVAVPYLSSEVHFIKLFLVKQTQKEFEMIDWFSLDCTEFSVKDLNHDGIDEILATHEGILSNVTPFKTCELISLKNNNVDVIYQSYSQDESKVFHKDTHKTGDTLSTWIANRLTDIDNDSTFEMMEIRKFTRIDEISGSEVRTTVSFDSAIIKLF